MKFGQLMSKIEELLINSYVNETVKLELKNFNKLVLENKNASTPAIAESDNIVSSTLIDTFPHRIVASRKLES